MIHLLRLILLLLCLPLACAHLPDIQPAETPSPSACSDCDRVFPHGDWQLLHAIEATAPGGRKQTILGLNQMSSARRTAHCVMMTLEGMVLFEADYGSGAIDIRRAVAPFDRPGMAEGIIEDLRLIFFRPNRPGMQTGILPNGMRVCRWALSDGGTQDIEIQNNTHWVIHRYNRRHRIVRTVRPDPDQGRSAQGMPNHIILEAHGVAGYRLSISLVEAEPMTHQPKLKKVNPCD